LEVYSNLSSIQLSETLDKIDKNNKEELSEEEMELAVKLINQVKGKK